MKHKKWLSMSLLVSLFLLFGLVSCEKNEEKITANTPPEITFISDEQGFQQGNLIKGAQGQKMLISAKLEDEVGIQSFTISYAEWNLNNTVDLTSYYPGEILTDYHMEYYFEIPAEASVTQVHQIQLSVTNRGDLSSQEQIIVSLDGDYEPPTIENLSPGNNMTIPPEEISLNFEVIDNMAIDYVVVDIPSLEVYDSIYEFEDPTYYYYERALDGQSGEKYDYAIRTSDKFKNDVNKAAAFNVGIPQIVHLFLVDKNTQDELDLGLMGTTLRMEPTGNDSEYSIIYYC